MKARKRQTSFTSGKTKLSFQAETVVIRLTSSLSIPSLFRNMLTHHTCSIITVTITTAKRETPFANLAASAVSMDPASEGFILPGAWTVAVAVCPAASVPLGRTVPFPPMTIFLLAGAAILTVDTRATATTVMGTRMPSSAG